VLQFDVVAQRLKDEYKVDCQFEGVSVQTARWIQCEDEAMLTQFKNKAETALALDQSGDLV